MEAQRDARPGGKTDGTTVSCGQTSWTRLLKHRRAWISVQWRRQQQLSEAGRWAAKQQNTPSNPIDLPSSRGTRTRRHARRFGARVASSAVGAGGK
ncbi:hypothetical protein GUJ93_ZPchr0008g12491 [Zizania palustris]|uniref:Uncharacterized protein n=1 Tax=Zizania palustris TaxID=103762 RepID=A0A8J5QZQ5_ZIZPA|nr:hypothetical protein GUJ93_ZPchr0008g12491 [Zizania palustris]